MLAKVIRRESFERMLKLPENPRHKMILRLLWALGLRTSEVTTIKIEDVDGKTINILDAKKHRYFRLPIDSKTAEMLAEYIQGRSGWLFPNRFDSSKHITRQAVNYIVGKYANGEKFHPRDYRRRFARNWVNRKGSLTGLQQILRHTNISSTAVYVDGIRFEDEIRKEYDSIMGN